MNRIEKRFAAVVGGLLAVVAIRADVSPAGENPYQVIIDRNPFGLRPPPAAAPPTNPAPVEPPSDIHLTGVTSNALGKQAWLMISPKPGKDPTPVYLHLSEHEKQGDIEVVSINVDDSTVKVLNAGKPVDLDLQDNGIKAPTSLPGAAPVPHPPGRLPIPPPRPVPGIPVKTAGLRPGVASPISGRQYRIPSNPASPESGQGYSYPIPSRAVRSTPVIMTQPQAATPQQETTQTAPSVDPAAQRVAMEALRYRAQQEGLSYPPLPPLPGALPQAEQK
jgi:hypothetical protein